MGQYRKKPVVIEATQWFKNGDHPNDYAKDHVGIENNEPRTFTGAERKANGWEGSVVRYFRRPDVDGKRGCQHCSHTMHEHGWIDTLEGGHVVCPGDFIITGVKGETYPCKPDIFAATYEPAAHRPALVYQDFADAPADGTEVVYLHKGGYISSCAWRDADEGQNEGWWDDAIGEYVTPSHWLGVLPKQKPEAA